MGQERLRRVTESDKERLFVWANDPVTREQSFSQETISWEKHCAWFAQKMQDRSCFHYILEADNEPVGVLRLDCCETAYDKLDGNTDAFAVTGENAYRISYSVAPGQRGHGYGKKILQLAEYHAVMDIPDCAVLLGEVKAGNTASLRCFESRGFHRKEVLTDENVDGRESELCFRKHLDRTACIVFRADANASVGNGHVMRCLTIADACFKAGMYPIFVCAGTEAEELIQGRGYTVKILHTDYRKVEDELPKWKEWIPEGSFVVLDSYYLTKAYVDELLKKGYRTVWLDDTGEQKYTVNLLINYNLYAEELGYETRYRDEHTKCLLGAAYAPVRPAFCKKVYQVRNNLERVMITTGAADPHHAGFFFAKELAESGLVKEIDIVCGPYHDDILRLRELAARMQENGRTQIKILQNLSDLSDVMYHSDLAIAAAGSTLYELCAVGVPTFTYLFADNQRQGAFAFARQAKSVCLGDVRTDVDRMREMLCGEIQRLQEPKCREALSRYMQDVSDGRGAERIAETMKSFFE